MIEWSESLATGNSEIDGQHKELFSRFGALLKACNQKKGREEVLHLFTFLDEYVRAHFSLEEKLQLQSGYPGYQEHKLHHDRFICDLQQLEQQLQESGATVMLVIKTNHTMTDWLINHINITDRQLAAYLRARS